MNRNTVVVMLVLLLGVSGAAPAGARRENGLLTVATNRDTIASEMRRVLKAEFEQWYPRSLDTLYGGFYSDFNSTWELEGRQNKMIVMEARHVWSASNAAMFYQKDNALRDVAAHGAEFLKHAMWDKQYGGFYDLVDRRGEPVQEDGRIIKKAYGNAFAIYGLAAYYCASGDTNALNLARETFSWLDKHSHDPEHGGYFQFLSREGVPFTDGYRGSPPKDQNSTIHLLECFTELYKVWPDRTLKERLHSLLRIVRDTITTSRGTMVLYFKRDWTPVSFRDSSSAVRERNYELEHVSFGHDVETGYLMLEAAEALGMKNDAATLRVAKRMVDHALKNGWDEERGGLYDGGYYFRGEERPKILRNTKEWWAQVEAFNSFLLMSELFPDDEMRYYEKFCIQWNYCMNYLIDHEHGGWYWRGLDIEPQNKSAPKGTIWKGNYHTSRSMINCIRKLHRSTLKFGGKQYDPVNKNATPEARKLLNRLYSLSGKRIVAGHHNSVGRIERYPDRVRELTGKTPQLWGCDFANYDKPGHAEQVVQAAYKKHQEGYTITLMWHAGRPLDDPPFGWKESIQAKLTDKEWEELITPGTALNGRWIRQVDTIAAYLKKLQVLGVPVLWRPYHELNGVWFWWGNRKGEKGSAGLYRMMYDRFVNHHRLDNLLWVWNTNAPRSLIKDEAYAYEDYFPGLEYVDVLAADVYHHDYRQSHHDELAELGQGKLIALGEVGEVPTPEVLTEQPMWVWFMIWGNFVDTHNTPQQMKDLYSYPRILTHEDALRGE